MELSILLPAYNEAGNISEVIKQVKSAADKLDVEYEIIVADGQSKDNTVEIAKRSGVKVFVRSVVQFNAALKEGFPRCKGKYIIMLDTDLSHPPKYILDLWKHKDDADIVVCSRYVEGGSGEMTKFRWFMSRFTNVVYKTLLGISATDLNCSYRLYHREVTEKIKLEGIESEVYPEILCKALMMGYKVKDIPFHYKARKAGSSTMRFFKYMKTYGFLLVRLMLYRIGIKRLRR